MPQRTEEMPSISKVSQMKQYLSFLPPPASSPVHLLIHSTRGCSIQTLIHHSQKHYGQLSWFSVFSSCCVLPRLILRLPLPQLRRSPSPWFARHAQHLISLLGVLASQTHRLLPSTVCLPRMAQLPVSLSAPLLR